MTRTESLMNYLDRAPTAYHAVEEAGLLLREAGFVELKEREAWNLADRSRYFVRRQDSSIIAFRTGRCAPDVTGFRIAAAHTDSPGYKIKANSENLNAGALRVTVEEYGGPIRSSWLDRELGLAGRVLIRNDHGLATSLFDTGNPCAMIPNAAIHLNREINKGVEYNVQDQMRAVLTVSATAPETDGYVSKLIARTLKIPVDSIEDYDLFLYPTEPSRIVGENRDMFMSGRIDNLAMSHAIVSALIETEENDSVVVAALFDSEEIGSVTWQGAGSWFLRDALRRITLCCNVGEEGFFRALAGSFLVSGDAAHAVHPNYRDKHDDKFAPELNKGPVVKIHAGGAYTTTADTGGRFIDLCRRNNIPAQRFLNRSDMVSGRTIGPAASSWLGVPSVDIGTAIWGMHSIRETAGVRDQEYMTDALIAFYQA